MADKPSFPCSAKIPATAEERNNIRGFVRQWVCSIDLFPPVSLPELQDFAEEIVKLKEISPLFTDFVTVVVSNVLWEETLAAIPYERRILLLPQCLRDRKTCPAKIDDFGLLCESCGACPTGDLQDRAEALGYVVLVAEGTTVVTQLIETGQIDAVVGVSCLATLERSFPYMTSTGTPGLAIPLIRDGCDATEVDITWVREAIELDGGGQWTPGVDLDAIKTEVQQWFEPAALTHSLNQNSTDAEKIACQWMAQGGKRWRPVLTAAVAAALVGNDAMGDPILKQVALAIECFHKASLAHDDIEDGDVLRYDAETLHRSHGVPVALNVGDFLIGEGYRLISESGACADSCAQMVVLASRGHRELCLGQGMELAWTSNPSPLPVDEVLEIFDRKTAPAFEVALGLGAICSGHGENPFVTTALGKFSSALGIAYQIRDDIEDFSAGNDIGAMRPSLLLALALKHGKEPVRDRLVNMLREAHWSDGGALVRETVRSLSLEDVAWQMFDEYKNQALLALVEIKNSRLKSLLYRVVFKVLKVSHSRASSAPPKEAVAEKLPSLSSTG